MGRGRVRSMFQGYSLKHASLCSEIFKKVRLKGLLSYLPVYLSNTCRTAANRILRSTSTIPTARKRCCFWVRGLTLFSTVFCWCQILVSRISHGSTGSDCLGSPRAPADSGPLPRAGQPRASEVPGAEKSGQAAPQLRPGGAVRWLSWKPKVWIQKKLEVFYRIIIEQNV